MKTDKFGRITDEIIARAKSVKTGIKKVMIVDDNYFAVEHYKHVLKILDPDIEVIEAATSKEAKEKFLLNKDDIGLVLMDFRLADAGSGDRLTENFLIVKPDVIILANSAYKSYNERIIAAGAVDAIQKKIPEFFEWWISYFKKD